MNLLKKLRKSIISNNFYSFLQKCFYEVNPQKKFLNNFHIQLMCEKLQAVANGKIKRLIITLPPRNLKSLCTTVALPAFLLGHDPTKRVLCASYNMDLSIKHSLDCRKIMHSPWYKKIFPNTIIAKGMDTREKFSTTKSGYRFTTSVGGTLTGEGGDIIIVDDPHNARDISSLSKLRGTCEWYENCLVSRLDDKKNGAIIVVMQRLHKNDLVGHLTSKDGHLWEIINLPAIFDEDQSFELENEVVTKKKGEALHPERESVQDLEALRAEIGAFTFAAQYLQNPVIKEGAIIKKTDIQEFTPDEKTEFENVVISWDTAQKSADSNDYTAATVWGVSEDNYYLLETKREKVNYPSLKHMLEDMNQQWSPSMHIIEDKGSGTPLIQEFKNSSIPILAYNPKLSKEMRFMLASSAFEAQKVYFNKQMHNLSDVYGEILEFPYSEHDDIVDSITQALIYLRDREKQHLKIRSFMEKKTDIDIDSTKNLR